MIAASSATAFEFVQSLCDGIEGFTARRVRSDRDAFIYRGADLRYAVERAMYIRLVNDAALCATFRSSPHAGVAIPDALCAPPPLARRLRQWLDRPSRTEPMPPGPPVLVHVIQEKFVRYLQPVMDRLPVPYAYLGALNPAMTPAFARLGVPHIDLSSLDLPSPRVPRALLDFGELPAWYDRIFAALSMLRPRCVVLVEGNAAQDEVVNRACLALGIPTVCVQQGWSPFVHNGFRNMSYTEMAVWGEGFADVLRPFNASQRFTATGHHGLTGVGRASRDGNCTPAIGFFLQAAGPLISEAAWSEFLTLIRRTAETFGSSRIIVRSHPAHDLTDAEVRALSMPNVQLSHPSAQSLDEVLSNVDIVVSIYSTVLVEGVAVGAIPVVVNLTSMPAYLPDVAGAGVGIEVRDSNSALASIGRLMADEELRRSIAAGAETFRKNFFASNGSPADRIASLIGRYAGT